MHQVNNESQAPQRLLPEIQSLLRDLYIFEGLVAQTPFCAVAFSATIEMIANKPTKTTACLPANHLRLVLRVAFLSLANLSFGIDSLPA